MTIRRFSLLFGTADLATQAVLLREAIAVAENSPVWSKKLRLFIGLAILDFRLGTGD